MEKVRIGIIGAGNMGTNHAGFVQKVADAELAAICDVDQSAREKAATKFGCPVFPTYEALIESNLVDGVIVATPHYQHTTVGIDVLSAGLHLLVEKPISVHKADCEKLIASKKNSTQVFAAMFNQRTDPHYVKVRDAINRGELGEITRVNWIITDWFRPEAYYRSGGWRATWAGEGGGVLLNQCPHQLDLLQWLCGMPVSVRAFCGIGKRHPIEVEDEVTAYFEYANGATGVFITSTGEAPGVNRLEICGERGRFVIENGAVTFFRNTVAQTEFSKTAPGIFSRPECWTITIPVTGVGGQHQEVITNFVAAIKSGVPLIAPAEEGIRSVELANAMLYSSFTNSTVSLPLDGALYESFLSTLIASSTFKKPETVAAEGSIASSF